MRRQVLRCAALALVYAVTMTAPLMAEAAQNMRQASARALADPNVPLDLSLADAQYFALRNHPNIAISAFDLAAAKEGIAIARSVYAPQVYGTAVSAVAPPNTRIGAYNELSDPTIIQRTSVGVGVQQYVSDFGRTTALVQASEAQLRAQAAQTQATRDAVLLNVTQSYFEVLRSRTLVVVAGDSIRERQLVLKRASALQRAGLRSMLDVSVAARDVATARQELLAAQGNEAAALAAFSQALGFNSVHIYRLRDLRSLPALPTLTPLLTEALRLSPDVASARASADVARSQADVQDRSNYPTLSAYGFFGLNPLRDQTETLKSSYETVGIALNVPLFTGGMLEAQRREAEDLAHAASLQIQQQQNQVSQDVRDAYSAVETSRGQIEASHQALATAREALRLTQARYTIGLSSIVDISQAQLSAEQAAIDATNARYNYLVQAALLEYSTGLIAAGDVLH